MGGKHEIGISLPALLVAALTLILLEFQRRLVKTAIERQEIRLPRTLELLSALCRCNRSPSF